MQAILQQPPPRSAPRPAKPQPADRRPGWPALAWGSLGFASGIVFWHFVGFWSFVSNVVFKTEAPASYAAPAREPASANDQRKPQTTVYGGIPATEPSRTGACTLLRLDRNTDRTTALPCDETPLPMAGAQAVRRWTQAPSVLDRARDARRAPAVAGWSTSVQEISGTDPDRAAAIADSVLEPR